jgi:hypothetical protein
VNPTARLATTFGVPDATRAPASPSNAPAIRGTRAPTRTRTATALTATALTFLLFLFATTASALATTGHTPPPTTFGSAGTEDGQFTGAPTGVAVGTAGEVFATDAGNSRIESFTATGTFKSQFPINAVEFASPGPLAVDSSAAGGVYVALIKAETGAPEVAKYSTAGTFEYTLNPGLTTAINYGAVTVDPATGTVYTLATNTETFQPVIDSFDQKTGAFIAAFTGETASPDGPFLCPSAIAADNAGHLFVSDPCKAPRVDRYSDTGTYEATVDDGSRGSPQALATDPETGDLYVAQTGPSGLQVTYFSAAAAPQSFSATAVGALAGLAVGPDATLYAGDNANSLIDRFAAFEGPSVTTEAASPVETRTATLNATINPNAIAAKYHYEYGTEVTYGSSTPEEEAGSGSADVPAPATLTGLVPNTTYHYRIVGVNASGSIYGADLTLTTVATPPTLDGSPAFASAITPTGALAHATVNPEHSLTTFRIEYGSSASYGASAPEPNAEVGEQSVDTAVATPLTGLTPDTLYHFRLSAENGVEGAQTGADATFITAPAAPATGSELTTKKAKLTGTINPHGLATTYRFNYGPSTAYGASSPELSAGSGDGDQLVTEHIAGLSPGTIYHVQVVATTNGITRSGADGTFTTPPAPDASISDPTAVTTTSATLQGAADLHGLAGSYHFEVVAPDGSYSANTEERSLSAGTGAQPVSVPVSGLPPGESFQVRLILTSNESTDYSDRVAFSTPPLPPPGFPAPPPPGSVYGCASPHLNPYNAKAVPGTTISITGSDLGLAGSVLLGEESPTPGNWSQGGFTVALPGDATGTLALIVNCGHVSNTIAIATGRAPVGPSGDFTIAKRSVKGATATLTVSLPGAGRLQSSSARTKGTSSTVGKAETQTVQVTLSKAGAKALKKAKSHKITVNVQVRFTPTGGAAGSQTASVTFKRKRGH